MLCNVLCAATLTSVAFSHPRSAPVKALLDVLDPPLSDTLLASMDSAEIRERMRASDEVSPIVKRALERFWKRLDEEKNGDTPAGLT
jgi:hypothetical protein